MWGEAINKELGQMNEFKVFKVLENNELMPKGYKKIPTI